MHGHKILILLLLFALVTPNSFAQTRIQTNTVDCSILTVHECAAAFITVNVDEGIGTNGRPIYGQKKIVLNEHTSRDDLRLAQTKILADIGFAVDLLSDFKVNMREVAENGGFGLDTRKEYEFFPDYTEYTTGLNFQISEMERHGRSAQDALTKEIPGRTAGELLRSARGSAREAYFEILLLEKYGVLRIQPARLAALVACTPEEIRGGSIPYLSDHFTHYPDYAVFRERALSNENMYGQENRSEDNDLSRQDRSLDPPQNPFLTSWVESNNTWQAYWLNPPSNWCQSQPPRDEPTQPPRDDPTQPPRDEPTDPPNDEPTQPPRDEPTTARTKTLAVAAINITLDQFSIETLEVRLRELMTAHPDTEIVVTPEYLLYGNGSNFENEYSKHPVTIECIPTGCLVSARESEKSMELQESIQTIQDVAKEYETSIVLGTVAVFDTVQGIDISYDSQLVIDNTGIIRASHAKADIFTYLNEEDRPDDTDLSTSNAFSVAVLEKAVLTAQVVSLPDREGNTYSILPHICGEKGNQKFIDAVKGSEAYLVIASDYDVDFKYEEIMNAIQEGKDPFSDPVLSQQTNAHLLKYIYQGKWITNEILQENNSYLLVADSLGQGSGIISWDLQPIIDLDVKDNYIYGKITIPEDAA